MAWISEKQHLVLLYPSLLLPSHEAQHVLLNGSRPSWIDSLYFLQENTQCGRDVPSLHGQGSQSNANHWTPRAPPAHSSLSFSTEKSRRNSRSFLRKTKKDSSSSVEPMFLSPQFCSSWPPRWRLHTRPCSSGSSRASWAGKPLVSHSAHPLPPPRDNRTCFTGRNLRNLSLFPLGWPEYSRVPLGVPGTHI